MKLRKHRGNKTYKIVWAERSAPKVIKQRVLPNGKLQRITEPGDFLARPAVIVTGSNPTSVRNAFLFGRDKTNIRVTVSEFNPEQTLQGVVKTLRYAVGAESLPRVILGGGFR